MTATPPPEAPAPSPRAQSAGRGLLFITIAKLWFMVGGAALGLLLPRMFPRNVGVERFGEWGLVLSCMSTLNNVLITGTIQGVARFVARGADWIGGTQRVALRVNVLVVAVVGLAYFLAAPAIAAWEKNPGITSPLRLSTGVVLCYGLYPVFVGVANGAREFHKQAGLDMAFTTLRAGFVLAAAAIFSTVLAAVAGFVAAAATVLALSVVVVGWQPERQRPRASQWIGYAAPVALYLLVQNLLMFVDYWLIAHYVAVAAERGGSSAAAATSIASRAVGAYNAALQVARLPYQATLAVTFVVFPLVSQASFANDVERTRDYIRKSVRLSLLVVVTAAAAAASRPDSILLLVFPKNAAGGNDYLAGAAALGPLMFAYASFSLLAIASAILNGAGATRAALAIGAGTLLLDAAANALAINWALDSGRSAIAAAGAATALAMGTGVVASLFYLQYRFGASLPVRSAARVALAAALAIATGRALPLPGRAGVLACVAAAAVYVVVLVASREVTASEARSLLHRR